MNALAAEAPVAPFPGLSAEAIGQLMPMFLWLDGEGQIRAAGPTLAKVLGRMEGQDFFALFRVKSPASARRPEELLLAPGRRLHVQPRALPGWWLRGTVVPLAEGGVLINLSFGIGIAEAVRDFDLRDADFAATDLAIEMLYLVEVKTAVLEELRALNERLQGAKSQAEAEAVTDMLTVLGNRRAMDRALAAAVETGEPFGLMQIDLDYFKTVNDSFGHAAGDFVLQEVARVFRSATREGDGVARIGGDEFVLILRGPVDQPQLASIAQRILIALAPPIIFEGRACRVSASIGAMLVPRQNTRSADELLVLTDAALYESKRKGRACYTMVKPGGKGAA